MAELRRTVDLVSQQADDYCALVHEFSSAIRRGGTIYFAGNGGSAADAQHIATEYVVRYRQNRAPLPAVALTTDTSLLTATGNDLSFDEIFSRQVDALCEERDLLVLHSTSGESENLVRAARAARAIGTRVVALIGKGGGRLRELVDVALVIPSNSTSHIQEMHLAIEHLICEAVEEIVLDAGAKSQV